MKYKILSLGNIYFQIDNIHYPLDSLKINKEFVGSQYITYAGSSALNFIRVIKSLGLSSIFIGKMGNDLQGDIVKKMLREEGIELSPIISQNHQTNLSMNYVSTDGSYVMFVSGTANQSLKFKELEEILKQLLPQSEYLYLGGIFKLKNLLPHLSAIIDLAKKHNVKIILDHNRITNSTTKEDKDNILQILSLVDYYLPSAEELIELLSVASIDQAIEKIKILTKKIIVIKSAENGSIGIKNNKIIKVPAFKVKVLNSIGAGDSFNAGFIKALDEGLEFEECLKFANATAALKISRKEIPTLQEIEKLCQKN